MKKEKLDKEEIKKEKINKQQKNNKQINKKEMSRKESKEKIQKDTGKQEDKENKENREKQYNKYEKSHKYHKYLLYLVIFSILALLLESIFCIIGEKFLNKGTGLVLGPLCLIYGLGAIITIICLKRFQGHKIKLFILGAILGVAIEYTIGFITESIFGAKLWNCSWSKFNINGRVCLEHALLWGISTIILINIGIKYIDKIIDKIQGKAKVIVDIILTIIVFFTLMLTTWGIITYSVRAKETLDGKNYISNNNIIEKFQNKVFSNEIMEKIFPRIEIIDNEGNTVLIKDING